VGTKHTNGYCPTTVSIFEGMRRGCSSPWNFSLLTQARLPVMDTLYPRTIIYSCILGPPELTVM
jgi:hypothetical protein